MKQTNMRRLTGFFRSYDNRVAAYFALEGLLFQFSTSIKGFGNNLFATNLGASDMQIGLIHTIGCIVTLAMLVPVGAIADTRKSIKSVPVALLLACGAAFIFQAFVPQMGGARVIMYFIFMGLASGFLDRIIHSGRQCLAIWWTPTNAIAYMPFAIA